MTRINVHAPEVMHVDVTVTGLREMRARVWVAKQLIRLAAWLMGGVGRIEVTKGERE